MPCETTITVMSISTKMMSFSLNNSINSTISNATDDSPSIEYLPYDRRPETYIVPVLFGIIMLVGTTGNGILLFIFAKQKSLRSTPNLYIANLAVGDLTVILGTVPFIGTIYLVESWPFGLFLCKLSEFLRDLSMGVTVFTLTALSVERYAAIVLPMQRYPRQHSNRAIVTSTVIFVWIISALLAFPGAYFSFIWEVPVTVNGHNETILVCYPFPEDAWPWYPKATVVSKFFLFYAIPLTIIGTLYALMARSLVRASRNVLAVEITNHARQIRSRSKVAHMVLILVILFAVCLFPNQVFLLWFYLNPDSEIVYNDFWHTLKILGYLLTFVSSCVNPVALFWVSDIFRTFYKRYLFCLCFGRRRRRYAGNQLNTNTNSSSPTTQYVGTQILRSISLKS